MSRNKGFTLIELMIALAIVAIISAIAYPAYTKSAMKGRRGEAKAALTQASQALERCYTQYGTYNNAACTEYSAVTGGAYVDTQNHFYHVTGTVTGTTYTLTATAVSTGPQNSDTGCTAMTLDNTGAQGPSAGSCW
jgi:type IV pilus assembly protein PilE